MHAFKDNEGREWEVKLNLAVEKEVHHEAGVYLSDLSDQSTIVRLENDPGLLGNVLWALVKGQAKAAEVTRESFWASLGGDSTEAAFEAVVEETLDFLGRRGRTIRAHRTERQRIEQEMEETNLQGLKDLSGEQAYALLTSLLGGSTASAGSAAASSESIPETSDSAS